MFEKSSITLLKHSFRAAMMVHFIRAFSATYKDDVNKLEEVTKIQEAKINQNYEELFTAKQQE